MTGPQFCFVLAAIYSSHLADNKARKWAAVWFTALGLLMWVGEVIK